MRRPRDPASEPDLETQLRIAFEAVDPEAAWYFDRLMDRVVRVYRGATDIPDLPVADVENDELRYVEIPALTESDEHGWMEEFIEARADAKIAPYLDERHGANERFLAKLEKSDAAAFAEWKTFRASRVAGVVAAWRAGLAGAAP